MWRETSVLRRAATPPFFSPTPFLTHHHHHLLLLLLPSSFPSFSFLSFFAPRTAHATGAQVGADGIQDCCGQCRADGPAKCAVATWLDQECYLKSEAQQAGGTVAKQGVFSCRPNANATQPPQLPPSPQPEAAETAAAAHDDAGCPYQGERKRVIFLCSATPLGGDRFRLFWGGGDGNVGTGVVQFKV